MLQKVFEYAAGLFAVLTLVGLLATGFFVAIEGWAGVTVYGVLTGLYAYLN